MNYEIFTVTDHITGEEQTHITVFLDEENARTFPADTANLDYVAFIEANPDALAEIAP